MCGISGIINKANQAVEQGQIKEINDLIAHRGPDDEGFYHGDNFSLGHRRLSIIGLGKEGHQPMDFQSKYVISYNGEIYNYIEIREELKTLDHQFNTNTDTEVILAAYDQWGEKCVEKFNGMWSFCIYDRDKNVLFCSRDRFGIKPFYYTETNDQFIFGSEIKQLLPFLAKRTANKNILLDFIIIGFEEHTNDTFFEGIQKLPAGHNMVYNLNSHQYSIKKYYSIRVKPELKSLSKSQAIESYGKTLKDAIKLRLRSDVKVGTCLSGGLDSSSVSALSSEYYDSSTGSFNAIHAKSSERASDESHYAQKVAEHSKLNLHVIEPSTEDFRSLIDEVVYTQEEPFGSPSIFMQYFVMKKAREINCIVMLDGQGGDETLLGYEKYYPSYLMHLSGAKRLKEFFNSSKNSRLSKIELFKYIFYFTKYKVRLKRLLKRNHFVKKELLRKFESDILKELSHSYLDIEALQRFEMTFTQLPHLLKYEDKNSMRNSIETRLPFIDYKVVETALSLNHEYKIHDGWTKYLLRKVIDSFLPKEVVWRKNKLGFNAPEHTWLQSLEGEMLTEIENSKLLGDLIDFSDLNLNNMNLRTKWKLYNIAKWEKIYHVEIN